MSNQIELEFYCPACGEYRLIKFIRPDKVAAIKADLFDNPDLFETTECDSCGGIMLRCNEKAE